VLKGFGSALRRGRLCAACLPEEKQTGY
jgi:hypothetical protein